MDFLSEIRYAVRSLTRAPGVTAIGALALALGIGLTGVMFSIVYGAMFRGLSFEGGDRIMTIRRANPERDVQQAWVPVHDYLDWRAAQTSFEELAAYFTGTVNMRSGERPERYDGAFITANGLTTLGVRPELGRLFREGEDVFGAPAVVILSHDAWRNRFGGDTDVLGRSVTVNGEPGEIIGVMPEGFSWPAVQEVWLPLRLDVAGLERGQGQWVNVYGRLRAGVSRDRAAAETTAIAAGLEDVQPEEMRGYVPVVLPFTETFLGDEPRTLLLTMLAAVFLVLLIACANVANLLLARASTRTRDVAVRTALGASRWRVARQLLGEAALLALLGALLGLGIAWVGIRLFDRAVAPADPPFWMVFRLDAPILAFVVAVTAVTTLVAGGLPALRASSTDVNAVLKDESRGASSLHVGRLSRGLVVAEIAMSMGLLVVAGLLARGVWTLARVELPYPSEDVFTARVGLFEAAFPDVESRRRFWTELQARLETEPGVVATSLSNPMPGQGSGIVGAAVEGESYPDEQSLPRVHQALISPGYFRVFDAEPLQGRTFTSQDGPDSEPVTVVNQSLARELFGGRDPVGRRIRVGPPGEGDEPWRTVVGVVPDLGMNGLGDTDPNPVLAGYYVPLAQGDARFLSVAVRPADGNPMALAARVRDAVASVDPDTPIYWPRTLQTALDENLWFYRVFGALFTVFGVAALFMASVGLYGVMAFSVSARTREIGVRMALGAESTRVVRLLLRQGMGQVGLGLVLGVGLALLLGRGMRVIIYDVSAVDPAVFSAVGLLLLVTALVAVLIPSLRATAVDPVRALSTE